MKFITPIFTAIFSLTLLLSQNVQAQSVQDYKFCNHYKFTYFLLKVYDINLCNNQSQSIEYQNLYNQDFGLIIEYDINIKKKKFIESSMEETARYYKLSNVRQNDYQEQLLNIFVDVKPKDQIAAIYQKSGTVNFYHNQKFIGKITDKEFSKIFLDIWLHPKAHYLEMRDDLLGGDKK